MSEAAMPTPQPAGTTVIGHPESDAGRHHLLRNVIWSWAGHSVFILTGFVMPRFVDGHLGQASLGMWDFGWSIVSYFGVAELGIGSSVNRYVAKHRAVGETEALCRTVSSVNCFQSLSGLVMLIATAIVVWQLPGMFGARLNTHVAEARWIIAFLGAAVAVQTSFDAYRGVITGCHRWDLHNTINASSQGLTTVGMMAVVSMGGDLTSLATVYFVGVAATELVRTNVARRVCPGLVVEWRYVSRHEMRKLVTFGGKTLVDGVSKMMLYQANNLLVVGHLGIAPLAVYARALALLRHAEVVTSKLAFVVTPAASSLKSRGREDDLRELLLTSTRYGAFVAIPIVVFLCILGDPLVQVWMGPAYRGGWVLPILAIGMLLPLLMRPTQHVLIGVNMHGRVGVATFVLAIAGIAAGAAMLGPLGMGLTGAALALAVPLAIGNGVFLCVYAGRQLGVSTGAYMSAVATPAACSIPFALALAAVRLAHMPALQTLLLGLAAGGAVLVPCYWMYATPPHLKQRLADRLSFRTKPVAAVR